MTSNKKSNMTLYSREVLRLRYPVSLAADLEVFKSDYFKKEGVNHFLLFIFSIYTFIQLSCFSTKFDAPFDWQMGFQDPATPIMEGIIDLHHDIFFFLVMVLIFVFWMVSRTIYFFRPQSDYLSKEKKYLHNVSFDVTHNTSLEIIWTVVPSAILMVVSLPSFALLYSMDEVISPEYTIKVVGNQWYWVYEYPPLAPDVVWETLSSSEDVPFYNYGSTGDVILTKQDFLDILRYAKKFTSPDEGLPTPPDVIFDKVISKCADQKEASHLLQWAMNLPLEYIELLETHPGDKIPFFLLANVSPGAEDPFTYITLEEYTSCVESEFANKNLGSEPLTFDDVSKLKTEYLSCVNGAINDFFMHKYQDGPEAHAPAFKTFKCHQALGGLEVRYTIQAANCQSDALVVEAIQDRAAVIGKYFDLKAMPTKYSTHVVDSIMLDKESLQAGYFRLLEVDNALIVPINTHIRVLVTSGDVIHSFAVPSLGVKVDACPGRLVQTTLYIFREGMYYGQCSEICGVNHAFMPIAVKAVDPSTFLEKLNSELVG